MAPTKKSIYRQPGTQTFQLVHRSVRDPLINDPEASQQVFKPVGRANESGKPAPGYSLSDLEATIDKSKVRDNEGMAAGYGIAYDDSKYDYMQHLKPVGEGGFESVLIAAPRGSGVAAGMKNQGNKGKGKMRAEDMFQLPESVRPSAYEMTYAEAQAAKEAIPRELQGLQPDMDPHLRQVLEALEDDAFVDEAGDEDVFGELLGSGELDEYEDGEEFEFEEWGVPEDGDDDAKTERGDDDDDDNNEPPKEETWEDRYRAFKAAGGRHAAPVSNGGWDEDEAAAERSEMADTIGSMVSNMGDLMVRGGKKRHGKRGPSDASGMSMSSASVYRNSNLRTLDDRFDRIEREYELEDDDDEWCGDDDDDVSIAPSYMSSASRVSMFSTGSKFMPGDQPEVTREDFESIMDDFLENYEVVGKRLRPAVGGTSLSGPEKLQVLRSAVEGVGEEAEENRRRILEIEAAGRSYVPTKEERDTLRIRDVVPEKEKWDVESILSTYTNTENHPGTIRLRSSEEAKARALRRAEAAAAAAAASTREPESESDSGSETERETPRVTVARPKGENAEDRKARKAAVKAERAGRRAEKKAHTQTFGEERKRQINSHKKAVAGGRAADLSVQRNVISL